MDTALLLTFLTTLFSIMNPFGAAPIYLALTGSMTANERNRVARQTVWAVFIILLVSLIAGQVILNVFGVSLDSFRVAGGLIIILMGLSMLRSEPSPIKHSKAVRSRLEAKDVTDDMSSQHIQNNPAFTPLAMPMIAGPGSIAAVILNSQKAEPLEAVFFALIIFLMCVLLFVVLTIAEKLQNLLGEESLSLLTRFMGLILTSLGVGMLVEGLVRLMPGLAG